MKKLSWLALAALLLVVVAVASAAWQEPGTAAPIGASGTSPQTDSLTLISFRPATIPSQSTVLLGLSGGVDSSVSPQTVPTEGGLTVSASGSVTVAADEAYVVIEPEQIFSSSGRGRMTDEDRQQIRENLAEIGVPEEAVEFETLARYGPSSISVEISLDELDELDEKKEAILEAVEEVIRRYEFYGVIYSLTEENCETALSLARREAIPRAERVADDLAEALGVERGTVIGALEYPLTNTAYGFTAYGLSGMNLRACGAQSSAPYPNLVPFDAEPEVEVSVALQITYGIR